MSSTIFLVPGFFQPSILILILIRRYKCTYYNYKLCGLWDQEQKPEPDITYSHSYYCEIIITKNPNLFQSLQLQGRRLWWEWVALFGTVNQEEE
jgi:hypothetical protein